MSIKDENKICWISFKLILPVEFASLGLIVVDEEQRFGVKHKEKLKKLRNSVDILTLTATPIPRTLHFSLMGVRDLSVIETHLLQLFHCLVQ